MLFATKLAASEVAAAAERAKLVKEAKLRADAAAKEAAKEATERAQAAFELERKMAAEKLKALEVKAKDALKRAELEEALKTLDMGKLVERLRTAVQSDEKGEHVTVECCCVRLAALVKDDSKQRTKAAVSGALHVLSGVMRSERHSTNVLILEQCCAALASILKASGLQHAAAEARCLKALAQTLTTMERHGLAAIKQIVHKNDEMRNKALAEGIREDWMPKEAEGKKRPGFDRNATVAAP